MFGHVAFDPGANLWMKHLDRVWNFKLKICCVKKIFTDKWRLRELEGGETEVLGDD